MVEGMWSHCGYLCSWLQPLWKTFGRYLPKTHFLAIPPLSTYNTKGTGVPPKSCTCMFIAASFIITLNQKPPQSLSKRMDTHLWCIHRMEGQTALLMSKSQHHHSSVDRAHPPRQYWLRRTRHTRKNKTGNADGSPSAQVTANKQWLVRLICTRDLFSFA